MLTAERAGAELRALVELLLRQRVLVLGFLGVVVASTLVGSLLTTKRYRAVAVIQLMPRAGQEVDVDAVVNLDDAGYLERRDRARTQIQIIQSRSVREEVIRRYNEAGHEDLELTQTGLDALLRSMSVGAREDTQLVEIGVLHEDAEQAALLANLVATVYREGSLTARTNAARETRVWLDSQTESYRDRLEAANDDVIAFKTEHDLVDIDANVDAISSRMLALQEALGEVTTERAKLEGILAEHERLLKQGDSGVLAGMLDDPALNTMAKERATIVTNSAEVLSRYGEQHPERQRAVEHIARMDGLIDTEVRRIVGEERAELRSLRRQEAEINASLAEVKEELLEKQHLQEQYADLKLEEDRARRLYASLGERGAEVDLQASSRLSDVRIVDEALPPERHATPNVPLNLAAGLLVGGLGGLGLAVVRERVSDKIRGPGDVEKRVGLPLLGALTRVPQGASPTERAFYGFDRPRSVPAEGFRSLRAVLMTFGSREGSRCIAVTSAVPEEGKTHTAIGVAIAFAQLGLEVLLVDADLRRPSLHGAFGLPAEPGLGEGILGGGVEATAWSPTRVPRLSLLSCGGPVDNPTELLGSPATGELVAGLRERFQVIVVDTAPAGLTSDAAAIAEHLDGLLLVVRQGHSERSVVEETVAQLRRVGAPLMGVALNDVPPPRIASGYGAGDYSDAERPEEAPAAQTP